MTTRGAGSEDLRENFMLSEWADVDLVKAHVRKVVMIRRKKKRNAGLRGEESCQ
jgi:hypothetical protein